MSAYACEPNKGSEPGVGWNWARHMSARHDLWVLTRANNRPNIEMTQLGGERSGVHWVYFDLPHWARFWKKGSRGTEIYYYLWQMAARSVGARLHRRIGFDLLHHVTFGKYWVPSYLALLPIKAILGPLGGGEATPKALASTFSRRGCRYERGRDLARALANFDPVMRSTFRRARIVAATTEESKTRIERLGAARVVVEPQVAMNDEDLDFFARFPTRQESPFRVISIGRLLHWKGFHLGLQAFARFSRDFPESEYWIVNDGPEAAVLKQLACELGIANRVTFWGHLPGLSDVYEKLAQSDALVHPATHEAFGNVCLEALAAGRPVICLDTGGPSMQVSEECGFKAPISSLDQALHSMAAAMALLYRSPELRLRMGASARDRVRRQFHWTPKAERMSALYEAACGSTEGFETSPHR